MKIRIGLPRFGGLLTAAKTLNAPLLISAGALMKPWRREDRWYVYFPGFRVPPQALAGCDVALDSAGFVAMVLTNGYEWTVEQYVSLAASFPWTWWSQMDLCCEPQIAGDRDTVRLRQAETARLYWRCAREAEHHLIQAPMPILQGWWPDDYARAVELLPSMAALVGVGSVCRRKISGPDGLEAIVTRLDRELPAGVQLHLFGVKSQAVKLLGDDPRIASVDSMAWDAHSRRVNRGQNTTARRAQVMADWYRRQQDRADQPSGRLQAMFDFGGPQGDVPDDLLALIAAGEIELQNVSHHFLQAWLYYSDGEVD